jgi:UrcA family protein
MKNPKTLLILTAASAATLASGGLSTIARADPLLEPRSEVVHFDDLDTNTTRGVELLYNRIKFAAERVCSDDLGTPRSLALSARYAGCVQNALSNAIGKVNRPLLNDFAAARGTVPSGAPIKEKVARTQPGQRAPF